MRKFASLSVKHTSMAELILIKYGGSLYLDLTDRLSFITQAKKKNSIYRLSISSVHTKMNFYFLIPSFKNG